MECEENLPIYSGGSDLVEWVDPTGFWPTREGQYRQIAEQLVALYGVTLCDEPDAALIGRFAHYYAQLPRSMTRWPDDFNKLHYYDFLNAYLQHNGRSYRDLPARFHPLFTASGVSAEARQQAFFTISAAELLAQIRSETSVYSVPTEVAAAAIPAQTGETTILGTGQDFPACRPGEARAFKTRCDRRASGHWSQAASSSLARSARYQRQKCGDREYSLRTDASANARAPLSDGLTPTRPPAAKAGYGFDCCILEAKYSGGGALSPYQPRARFERNVNARAALIRGPGSGVARRVFRRGQMARYDSTLANAGLQLSAYLGAVSDPDIPYWRVVYICSNERARDYFRRLINRTVVGRAVARACQSSMRRPTEHWIV